MQGQEGQLPFSGILSASRKASTRQTSKRKDERLAPETIFKRNVRRQRGVDVHAAVRQGVKCSRLGIAMTRHFEKGNKNFFTVSSCR